MERNPTKSTEQANQPPEEASQWSWIPKFLQKSEKPKNPGEPTNQFGLFRLYTLSNKALSDTPPSEETSGPYDADIVAIHGLGGAPYRTWTHGSGKLWLRDFALDQLPGSRIYTFGYDSGVAFSKGTGTLRDFARNLLESVKLERRTPEVSLPCRTE
jgi:hypothetical protein